MHKQINTKLNCIQPYSYANQRGIYILRFANLFFSLLVVEANFFLHECVITSDKVVNKKNFFLIIIEIFFFFYFSNFLFFIVVYLTKKKIVRNPELIRTSITFGSLFLSLNCIEFNSIRSSVLSLTLSLLILFFLFCKYLYPRPFLYRLLLLQRLSFILPLYIREKKIRKI